MDVFFLPDPFLPIILREYCKKNEGWCFETWKFHVVVYNPELTAFL
jgi:hypothetical protein